MCLSKWGIGNDRAKKGDRDDHGSFAIGDYEEDRHGRKRINGENQRRPEKAGRLAAGKCKRVRERGLAGETSRVKNRGGRRGEETVKYS